MTKKILQISPFAFDHLWWVEKYAEILQEIFPHPNPLPTGERDTKKAKSQISPLSPLKGGLDWEFSTLCGGRDFPIFEPVKNWSVPKIWKKEFWKQWRNISSHNAAIMLSHIRFAPTAWFAFWLAKRKKIPYIHIEHGTGFLVHTNFLVRNVAKIVDYTLGKYLLKNADFVICVSKAGEDWVKTFSGRTEKIETIYRGFTMPHPNPLLQGEGENWESWNLHTSPFCMEEEPNRDNTTLKIGFVGRLVSLKNVNTLIESLKNLEHLKWQCEIVGDGEMRAEWENMIKTYHLEDRIMFLWSRENQWILEDFYPNIDIFVNPSLQEWLPTTVIEAKMSGCEVLATDVGGTKEIPDIHLCEPHVESLTLHLENLIKNPLKKPISQAFFTQFSLSEMKKRFEYIFTRVIWK